MTAKVPSFFWPQITMTAKVPSPSEKGDVFSCRQEYRTASPLPGPPAVYPRRSGHGLTASTVSLRMTSICRPSGNFGWPSVRPRRKPGKPPPTPHVLPRRRRRGRYCLNKQRICPYRFSLTGACRPYDPAFSTEFIEWSVVFEKAKLQSRSLLHER